MTRSLVLLSGGMDSTVALAREVVHGRAAFALSVDYGQRHRKELAAATRIAATLGVEHDVLDLTGWGRLLTGSALTDPAVDVPHGHYAAPSMVLTIVPNRNATLLMAAAGVALAQGCDGVVIAVHAGDHPIYPDCRPEFITAAQLTLNYATEGKVAIRAPFIQRTKTDIAVMSVQFSAPLHLSWSCYEGGERHCGRCGTCTERIEAFRDAGIPDPTLYDPEYDPAP
jgi:7-cyano-7-deazaguanine synthase